MAREQDQPLAAHLSSQCELGRSWTKQKKTQIICIDICLGYETNKHPVKTMQERQEFLGHDFVSKIKHSYTGQNSDTSFSKKIFKLLFTRADTLTWPKFSTSEPWLEMILNSNVFNNPLCQLTQQLLPFSAVFVACIFGNDKQQQIILC